MDQERVPAQNQNEKGLGGFFKRWLGGFSGKKQSQVPEEQEHPEVVSESTPAVEKPEGPIYASLKVSSESKLYALWHQWNQAPEGAEWLLSLPWESSQDGASSITLEQQQSQLNQIQTKLNERAKQRLAAAEESQDGSVQVFVSQDKMAAWLFLFPPVGEGEAVRLAQLNTALQEAGVSYGILTSRLQQLDQSPEYLSLLWISEGTPPRHGKNGEVKERLPREVELQFAQQGNQDVLDYRSANRIRIINKGDVICDIIQPEEGEAGTNVLGATVPAKRGTLPPLPKGNHVVLSEDGSQLIADADGRLCFQQNAFHIQPILVIEGDVDYSTGNIDFIGDVVIRGDVRQGFSVCATGTITVDGLVEAATLTAEGDITIANGVLGDNRGVITSNQSLRVAYLENCVVYAGDSISADCVLNSQLYCNNEINVTTGRGTIIGCTLSATNRITTKVLGSKSGIVSEVILGQHSFSYVEKNQLEIGLEALRKESEELERNLAYLEKQTMTPEVSSKMSQLQLRLSAVVLKLEASQKRMEQLDEETTDVSRCRLVCDTVYPRVKLTIGAYSTNIRDAIPGCNARIDPDENQIVLS